ncbi:thioesterase family protein [Shewanella subflava]|uniref:Thioesterase family protein n=1 Tax=Shewanella subflava TaxID=2986476 RepID=A0ABT3IBV7_9GAMM|nr:thioesterase family protein [Shewanella subflava]MCW3173450.1 thioesterase family protein [Shewanella subflava]
MILRFRFLFLIFIHYFKRSIGVLDENTLHFRVFINDVDVKRMSSDRYLPIMDLGRINIILQAGLLNAFLKNKWVPVARIATVRYRYPLKIFERYLLKSSIIYWDDEWVWTEHKFERNGKVTAVGITKITFVGANGMVPITEVIEAYGYPVAKLAMPEAIKELMRVELNMRKE